MSLNIKNTRMESKEAIKMLSSVMKKTSNAEPAKIYAFEKTGILLTEINKHLFSEDYLNEWDNAKREYHDKKGENKWMQKERLQ